MFVAYDYYYYLFLMGTCFVILLILMGQLGQHKNKLGKMICVFSILIKKLEFKL